jgi:CBS domain-containing protein
MYTDGDTREEPIMAIVTLLAETAAELMTRNPVSLDAETTTDEAAKLLTTSGISAAVVIDAAGRPVGVVTKTDLLTHARHQKTIAATPIQDAMTTAVFTVRTDTPARSVVEQFLALNVHHLFVVDSADTLVGVISPMDVLKKLG